MRKRRHLVVPSRNLVVVVVVVEGGERDCI
jgi:hypothetical protein